ncbi:TPA: LysM peptidoglycan-binding domain-containing protein [Streptococcus suis]
MERKLLRKRKGQWVTATVALLIAGAVGQQVTQAQETTTTPTAIVVDPNAASHTVSQGQTLFRIAQAYKVTVAQLREWNQLSSDAIYPGQSLIVKAPLAAEATTSETTSATTSVATTSTSTTTNQPTPATSAPQTSPSTTEAGQTYRVQAGDTLSKIARTNKITVTQLKTWNNLTTDTIRVGQVLKLSGTTTTTATPSVTTPNPSTSTQPSTTTSPIPLASPTKSVVYTVQAGDTLSKVARTHGLTLAQLREWNRLTSDNLLIGQVLNVSKPSGDHVGSTYQVNNTQTSGQAHENVGQRDLLKYIIAAEAGTTNANGIAAVTSVIFNRADAQGKSPYEVATANQQFIVYETKKWQNYVNANLAMVESVLADHEKGYRMHNYQNFYASGYFYNDGSYTASKNAIEKDLSPYVVTKQDIGGNTFFTPKADFPYKKADTVAEEVALLASRYTVVKGDTLSKIAAANKTSVANIKAWNKLTTDNIIVGQKLYVVNPNQVTTVKMPTPSNPAPVTPTVVANAKTYTVVRGDTLSKIAAANKVTVANLKAWNKLTSNTILVGQKLVLGAPTTTTPTAPAPTSPTTPKPTSPTTTPAPTTPTNTGTYTVVRGDTLSKIAAANKVTVAQLKSWNKLSSDVILVGQKLVLGAPTSSTSPTAPAPTTPAPTTPSTPKPTSPTTTPAPTTPTNAGTYTVVRGDTLSKIAAANKVTVAQLKSWNKLSSDVILVGQKLVLGAPTSSTTPTAPAPTTPAPTTPTTPKPTTPAPTSPTTTPAPTTPTNAGTYTVVRGDTLSKIARANNVTVAQIKAWNKLASDVIVVGQKLSLGAPTTSTSPSSPAPTSPSTSTGSTYTGSDLPDLTNAVMRPVNYDVKLNGKTEPLRTTLAKVASPTSVVTRFGQRFTVNREFVAGGVTYIELLQNGQVVGYTPKSASVEVPQGKTVIYLDAGHGGSESGAYTYGTAEKNLNLNITRQLADRLTQQGYVVYQTRTTDKTVDLRNRQVEPNAIMPDAYISVHHNAMPASRAGSMSGIVSLYHDESISEEGYETLAHHKGTNILPEGKRLAQALQAGMVNATGARNLGAQPQNLHVTRTTDVPATLVELGFQDNYAEFQKLTNYSYQQKLIQGLINGINNFFGKK